MSLSVVLVPAHVLGPAESDTVRAATLTIAVLGAWIGVLHIPAHRWTAACVAGSSSLVALGDVSSGVLSAVGWTVAGFSLSDLAFLLAYLVMWLGLRRLLPRGSRRSRAARLDGVIDAGAVLVVLAYVEWELAVATVGREGLSPSIVTVWMLYPFLDAALLALTVRIWASRRSRDAGLAFVALGLFCWFAADLGYLIAEESPGLGAWVEAGWLLANLCFTAAIWFRPRHTVQVAGGEGRPLTVARIGLALMPVLVPGSVEALADPRDDHGYTLVGLLVTAVLLLLAFARAARLLEDQVLLRASLHSQTRYSSALAANSSDAVVVLDREGGLTHDSAELSRLLGGDRPVPAGTKLLDVAVLTDRDEVEALLGRARGAEGSVVAAELCSRVDPQRLRWCGVRMVALTEDPDVAGVVVTVHEVTDRILAQQEIAHNALHDGLTGLANRALFDDRLDQALRRAERSGKWPVVLYVDLDRFKGVNDSHGHASGDQLLRETAARFLTAVRTGDTVARLGGDEFAVLLEQGRPAADADAVAERLMATLAVPFVLDNQRVRMSASIGLAVGDIGSTAAAMVRDADIAMYGGQGRGQGPGAAVRRGHARRGDRTCATGERPERGPGAAAVPAGVPAGGGSRHPAGRRLRGAAPLGPPGPGAGAAEFLHPDRRERRPHGGARAVGAPGRPAPRRRAGSGTTPRPVA